MSSKDSTRKTLLVAFCLCVVCSIVVSGTAVILKPRQDANKILDRNKNILQAAGLFNVDINNDDDVMDLFQSFSPRVVDLNEGKFLSTEELDELEIDVQTYDQRLLINDSNYSEALDRGSDMANIKRRVIYPMVYTTEDSAGLDTIVVPINGYGLWGIIYGFIALEGDANTVKGLAFYELKETPGLGAEVRNPRWTALWPGKKIYNEQGDVGIRVVRGQGSGDYQIDGLSGATLTSKGVDNLIRYWMGEDGYGPLLADIREAAGRNF
ncbi:MAG: Na(+)-translocating NADH-quinone reductase subunit C [Gammaproteobacteria bacterium]|nr:Na(+)-translocating NADH-quinone reductase subunit C [Gammaproteobacteria bacterium]MBT3858701.1 Na(+)-translocating NADH-quinone reductase subunit C [Gammaproteobacteria bacterium]MBT3986053.1 Na(+)-translocating NADH-quinone reductase subunit C [Gammaproteobacteria bacterium]MBT4254453.1 Na(+)-translocating NADH-quinone reductase subunit C [Gammaproteobacteria bacterium]MBT4580764.1 Na(+)-translocating NADH-quinone reductase subunit C [Gammaproteobacteria bacterium]